MSITTYSELQTAVADWMHRTDLTAKIPDFITLAESRINRAIKFNQQEVETSLTLASGSSIISIPSGMIRPIELWLTTWPPRAQLTYVSPEQLPVTTSQGAPTYWTIDGVYIAFDCEADQTYTFDFRYAVTDNLSSTNVSNWILENHPDVYLYAALIEGGAYVRDMELMQVAKGAYDMALQEVIEKEHRTKAKSTLFTELAGNYASDILEG